ncbi:hypothetical protein, partial [Serratia marcescens]|uniref:hypothetical protein n=1 Tax=Serratia marcescens TaxID=615 RepID=UPI001C3D1A96
MAVADILFTPYRMKIDIPFSRTRVRRRVLRRANPMQPTFDLSARIAPHPNPAALVAGDMHAPVAPTAAALSGDIAAA